MGAVRHFDLCVIGTGSGNSVVDERFDDWDVAIIEQNRFGGTCVNVGCIPSKMYVYPARLARLSAKAAELGVDLALGGVRWSAVRDRIFGRIDEMEASGRAWREKASNVTVYAEPARFVGPRRIAVGTDQEITAERVVVAAGARPVVPEIPGLDTVGYHTSDTIMRLPDRPSSLLIIGGGYVAAEFAHVFSAYGTDVTVVNRSERLLRREDDEIAQRFTELFGRQVDLLLHRQVDRVEPTGDGGVRARLSGPSGEPEDVEADLLLVAVGRVPNGDRLDVAAAGIELDEDGYVVVDDNSEPRRRGCSLSVTSVTPTSSSTSPTTEARVVQHNLLHPESMITSDHRFVPHAVFSDPEVASCGLTEAQAAEQQIAFRVGRANYSETAYGWAMEDRGHFVKVLVDVVTGQVIGAHLIGPHASSLIQPLIQAMSFGQRASDVAGDQYWIHPALAEVVENALLAGTREPSIAAKLDRPSRAAAPYARPAQPWSRPSWPRRSSGRTPGGGWEAGHRTPPRAAGFRPGPPAAPAGRSPRPGPWPARPPRPARP